jgi:PAS domain-containing protein
VADAANRGLTNPHVQEAILGEAAAGATVGIIVWDDTRCYVAANAAACALLGCTLEEIIGATVGNRTPDGSEMVERVVRGEGLRGRLTTERFDGSGPVELEYLTFPTRAAGLPYMASVIWPVERTPSS